MNVDKVRAVQEECSEDKCRWFRALNSIAALSYSISLARKKMTRSDTIGFSTAAETRVALELMLRYKARRKKGNETVSSDIARTVGSKLPSVSRQVLDHWFSGRRNIGDAALWTINAFIQSEVFLRIVPEAQAYVDQHKRTVVQGQVMAEFYGIHRRDSDQFFDLLGGHWAYDQDGMGFFRTDFSIVHPVEGQDFALVHLCTEFADAKKIVPGIPGYDLLLTDGSKHLEEGTVKDPMLFNVYSGFIFLGKENDQYSLKLWRRSDRFTTYDIDLRIDSNGELWPQVESRYPFARKLSERGELELFEEWKSRKKIKIGADVLVLFDEKLWSVLENEPTGD